MAKLRNKKKGILHMVSDLELGTGKVGDHTRGYWSSINNLHGARSLQGDQGEMVAAGKVFVHKGEAGGSIVDEGVGGNHTGIGGVTGTGKLASDDKMVPFQFLFPHSLLRQRATTDQQRFAPLAQRVAASYS